MMNKLKVAFAGRPLWMNAIMVFCAYMTFVYMPFDIFYKPVAEDEEVWFGYVLYGWAAKATAPLHWLIYGAGFFGFLHMKKWMHPWAAVYVFQVAIAMAVYPYLNHDAPLYAGLLVGLPFLILGVMLLRAKVRFDDHGDDPVATNAQQSTEQTMETKDG